MRDDSAAPAPSAEARRLIDETMETWSSLTWATRAKVEVVGEEAYTARVNEREAEHDTAENALLAYVAGLEAEVARLLTIYGSRFPLGARVRKTKGSSWHGRVVGFYSTALTPIGYAVESEHELGSVQIYPEAALEAWDGGR